MGSFLEEFRDEDREKNSGLIVAVDGPSASGKNTLAEHVAEVLGIKHFSASEVFYAIAKERGLEDVELSGEAEKEVDLEVDRKTLDRALEQSCVIDGRITAWVLGDYADLNVHLDADEGERARRLANREGMEREKAREVVRNRDRKDSLRYQNYYGIDTSDLKIYDLVIDNTELSIGEQNRLVDQVLEERFPERFRGEED